MPVSAGLLSCIGSWRDTMDDAEVLQMLKRWNEMGERISAAQLTPNRRVARQAKLPRHVKL
jgi:hypothetical protein